MRALVVLPTYNEIENIETVLRQTRAALPGGDGARRRRRQSGRDGRPGRGARRRARLHLGAAPPGQGRARQRRTGPGSGAASTRATTRSSRWTPTSRTTRRSCPSSCRRCEDGADLAIGSRYVPGGAIPDWPFLRRAISRIGCWYARIMLGLSVHDATAGFRAYRAEALREIDLDAVRADGYGFQIEMAYRVQGNGGRIVEVPIEFRDRTLGHSKMSGRIVVEALFLVTRWGLRDMLTGRRWRARRARGDSRVVTIREWVVAGALVEAPEGLLVVRNVRRGGHSDWSTPGGVIDAEDASVIAGLTREVEEETGLRVTRLGGSAVPGARRRARSGLVDARRDPPRGRVRGRAAGRGPRRDRGRGRVPAVGPVRGAARRRRPVGARAAHRVAGRAVGPRRTPRAYRYDVHGTSRDSMQVRRSAG